MQYVGVCECQIDNPLLGKKIKFSKTILVNIISKSLNSSVRELYAKHQNTTVQVHYLFLKAYK